MELKAASTVGRAERREPLKTALAVVYVEL